MSSERVKATYIEGAAGRLFLLLRTSPGSRRCVLIIPPFAEEMNRCRRQVSLTAERLTDGGFSVLVPDLYGTGDSAGEFVDATWNGWIDDVARAGAWAERQGLKVDSLVAVRLGCALAASCLREQAVFANHAVFWQPVDSGEAYLKQFLRLKVASAMARDRRETVAWLRTRLQQGDVLEVGGYALSPRLASEIEEVGPEIYEAIALEKISILEMGRRGSGEAVTPGQRIAKSLERQKIDVSMRLLEGEPYWASAEAALNPMLCEHTVASIAGATYGRR